MSKKYQITCTKEQLSLIARAVEDWSRFLSGQCEMTNATSMLENYHDLCDALSKYVEPLVVPELCIKYGRGASYGWSGGSCPNEYQRKAIAMSYGIYRQILHFFAKQLPDDHWNVYKFSTLTCKDQGGLIQIKEIKDANVQ